MQNDHPYNYGIMENAVHTLPERLYRNRNTQQNLKFISVTSTMILVASAVLHSVIGWILGSYVLTTIIPIFEWFVIFLRGVALRNYYSNGSFNNLVDVSHLLRLIDVSVLLNAVFSFVMFYVIGHMAVIHQGDIVLLCTLFMSACSILLDCVYRACMYRYLDHTQQEIFEFSNERFAWVDNRNDDAIVQYRYPAPVQYACCSCMDPIIELVWPRN